MEGKNKSWMEDNSQRSNLSQVNHHHNKGIDSIYVFTPAGNTEKIIICLFCSTLGIIGFLGNFSIFYFLGKKPKKKQIQTHFVRNLNLYIRSLSLSDLLTCAVGAPLLCVQISFDVSQSGWPCKITRYFQFVFPATTINTLVVTSLEKYISTRSVLRNPIGTSTMRNFVLCAWVFGLLFMLPASAAFDGLRVDLNNSHFTVICNNDEQFYPFKMTLLILPIQYVLPSLFVLFVNIHLARTVWSVGKNSVTIAVKDSFQAHLRAKKIKGTSLLIALTFGFITPFFFFVGNKLYTQIAKPQRDFRTAYLFRYGSAIIVFLAPVINFTIFITQMNDFREFLTEKVWRKKEKCETRRPNVVLMDTNGRNHPIVGRRNVAFMTHKNGHYNLSSVPSAQTIHPVL